MIIHRHVDSNTKIKQGKQQITFKNFGCHFKRMATVNELSNSHFNKYF